MMPKHIVILGAGVLGLEIARQLLAQENKDKYRVSIIAREFPGDLADEYTSPWTGGHWRSHASGSPTHERLRRWELATLEYWNNLITEGRGNEVGLKEYTQYHFWDTDTPIPQSGLWWAPHVSSFRALEPWTDPVSTLNSSSPSSHQIENAASCQSIAINVPQYLSHLFTTIHSLGARTHRATLTPPSSSPSTSLFSQISSITGSAPDQIINATALGSRHLFSDTTLFPIRGQTVLVRGEANAIRHRIGKDYEAYVIPRPGSGTTILGGTRVSDVWDTRVDEGVTGRILEGCRGLAPELLTGGKVEGKGKGGFEVISVQVGLRPARREGPRVERGEDGVVHAYGHAGAGFQMSFGVARDVLKLMEGKEERGSKL